MGEKVNEQKILVEQIEFSLGRKVTCFVRSQNILLVSSRKNKVMNYKWAFEQKFEFTAELNVFAHDSHVSSRHK